MKHTKEIVKFIEIDDELMKNLEILHFDIEGYQNILKLILTKKEFNNEVYEHFKNEYMECNRIYQLTKNELVNAYVPEEFNNKNYSYTFDFYKNGLELMKETEKGCCC